MARFICSLEQIISVCKSCLSLIFDYGKQNFFKLKIKGKLKQEFIKTVKQEFI